MDYGEQVESRLSQVPFRFADPRRRQAETFHPELLGRYKAVHQG
jgi:hypothetical protein